MSLLPMIIDLVSEPLENSWQYNRSPYNSGMRVHPNDLKWLTNVYNRRPCYTNCRRGDCQKMKSQDMNKSNTGKDGFQVCLDVEHFAPNEITVKTVDNTVVIEGKHEEKEDEYGHIYRHFIRRYELPKEYDVKDVVSTLSSDGVLTIKAPPAKAVESNERVIQIQQTGPAHLSVKTNPKPEETKEKLSE